MGCNFPSKEDPLLAEFIGILLGDGSIGIYKCKAGDKTKIQHRVQITLNSVDDKEYIKYVINLIVNLFSIKPTVSQRKGRTLDIRILKKDVVGFLINDIGMELAPKKNRAKIPDFYIGTHYETDIMRGCFDTDGSLVLTNNNGVLYPRLEIKVCQSPMKEQIINILKKNGFRFGVYELGAGEVRIQMNGRKELQKWSERIGFKNPKHYNKIERIK